MYYARLSQCRIQRSFQVVKSRENRWEIECAMSPSCPFRLVFTHCFKGVHMTQLIGHSCKISDHLIQEKTVKSPASNREFLCRYLMNHVRNNLKLPIKAIQIIIEELGCASVNYV
jgi:hypothetical protein